MATDDYLYYRYITPSTSATASTSYIAVDGNYPTHAENLELEDVKKKLAELDGLFFRKVVSKCPACGQWGAALSECKHCGYPIGLGEDFRMERKDE